MRYGVPDNYPMIRVVNKSDAIRGTECYGCDFCEVLVNRKKRIERERYYCNAKKRRVIPKDVHGCERRSV